MVTRRIITRSGLAATLLALTGCGALVDSGDSSGGNQSAEAKLLTDGTFTKAITADPGSLDPLHAVSPPARELISYSYESLLSVDNAGAPQPWLAESWKATTTTATFVLKPGIKCSDGTELTAATVAANIDFHAVPKNATFYFGSMVKAGTTATGDDASRTVTVRSAQPDPFLLNQIGSVQLVCAKGLANPKSLAAKTDGTGPYTLDKAVPEDRYILQRRSDWTWGPGGTTSATVGLPKTVVLRVIANESTAANLLLSGELNAAAIAGPDRRRASQAGLFSTGFKRPVGEFMFNEKAGRVTADPLVRQAIATAVDRAAVGTVLTDGQGTAPTSLVTLSPLACVQKEAPWNQPDYDLQAAGKLLDQAGWVPGPGGIRQKNGQPLLIKFIYDQGSATSPAAAELLTKAWQQLGIKTESKALNGAGWDDKLFKTGDWDAGFIQVTAGYPSFVAAFFAGATPPNGNNFMYVDNPEYKQLTQQASAATPEETCALWTKAEVSLVERYDVIPIVDLVDPIFAKKAEFAIKDGLDPTSIRLFA